MEIKQYKQAKLENENGNRRNFFRQMLQRYQNHHTNEILATNDF
jgi:hypothetical protein